MRFTNEVNGRVKGSRPCPREGFMNVLSNESKWIIVGGDRHKMSLNDIFELDLDFIEDIVK